MLLFEEQTKNNQKKDGRCCFLCLFFGFKKTVFKLVLFVEMEEEGGRDGMVAMAIWLRKRKRARLARDQTPSSPAGVRSQIFAASQTSEGSFFLFFSSSFSFDHREK